MFNVKPATLERVFEVIEKDADLDGVCTSSTKWVAEQLDISRDTVMSATTQLINANRIKVIDVDGKGQRTLELVYEEANA